ncbi:elongation of very long chain fatty acids protein 4-like [Hydractinia symbiolongicarpus]|uniref:elongation of very long chain fatty acids protein 4-like n=1 Tax=Hydractinia symbiolongicarpus TaxID=13093 RepID=UPI00254E619F|nr:elongation of very long chain fatty acids protein 4-like [Hydractinia symbiolongicarpus]
MDAITKLQDFYNKVDLMSDPRTNNWLFVTSPIPTYSLSLFYILFSWKIGPALMRKRQPMQLKHSLIIYNIAMTYLNFHIFKELLLGMIEAGYSFPCQPYDQSTAAPHIRIAAGIWWYYVSKLIEFIDTLFFILRKKDSHISFLHVYHHSTMPLLWWIGTKWVPGGQSAPAALINAFIHIIMYSYYGLAALGPAYQKYLWWKKYLTQMQLIQFCIALTVAVYSLATGCDFPQWMSWALILYMISFLILFGNFYLQAYIKRSAKRHKKSEEVVKNGTTKCENNGKVNKTTNGVASGNHYDLRRREDKKES